MLSRYIIQLLFLLTINSASLFGQDCKSLNSFNSFHGITFGKPLADSIRKYFVISNQDSSYTDYSLEKKMLQKNNLIFQKFYKWFIFGENNFSNLTISCLTDGRVFEFDLSKVYDKKDKNSNEDSSEIVNGSLPNTFLQTSEEITSLFDKPTRSENKNDILGQHYTEIWECEKIKIELHLWYKNESNLRFPSFTLLTGITITDIQLDKIQKLKSYQTK